MTAIGGMSQVVSDEQDFGLVLSFPPKNATSSMNEIYAPVAPGMVRPVRLNEVMKLRFGESRTFSGATMLAFDGERERVLKSGESVSVCVRRDGPRRVDVKACMEHAVTSNAGICVDLERVNEYAN